MTYCVERTNLLAEAGRELAESLLPKPFTLCYSDHSTGRQMRIMAPGSRGALTVWQGSVWHSHIYEFNDSHDFPGLQPEFAFAAVVIDTYFADVQAAIKKRDAENAASAARASVNADAERAADIEAIRKSIAA